MSETTFKNARPQKKYRERSQPVLISSIILSYDVNT